MVGRYHDLGIDEFVLYWPGNWRDVPQEVGVFDEVALRVVPELRAGEAAI